MNELTKDGLTGNSGFNVAGLSPLISHVSANYAATEGKVFVETEDMGWERMLKEDAEKQDRPIIRCTYCSNPAISVDHSWPYLNEATHCEDHRDWMKHMKERSE